MRPPTDEPRARYPLLALAVLFALTRMLGLSAAGWAAGGQEAAGRGTVADAVSADPGEPGLPPLQVSFVGSDAVYLNGGTSHGLSVGQVVAVVRQGEPVAELQVAFVSKKSASCRVVDSRREIVLGDRAIPIPGLGADAPAAVEGLSQTGSRASPDASSEIVSEPGDTVLSSPASSGPGWGRLSGTLSLRWHHFDDGSDVPRSFDETTERLNLRSHSASGTYETRVRVRGREDRRYSDSEPTDTSRRDRLYELAFAYQPPEGRVSFEIGRMASKPMLGFDYLDGALGELRVTPRFGFGGFYGRRSDVDEFGLGADGQAYGAFLHFQRKRTRDAPLYAEMVLGGIRELHEGEVSREFVSLYARLGSGSRWSFYQRADVDLNSAWRRELAGESYQLSNVLTTFYYRFTESLRLGISYDHRQRFRDFESRDTPEEIFDDRLREGLRLNAQIGDPHGWRLTTSIGVRREEDTAEDSYTGTGSLFHTNLGGHNLLLGADFSGFTAPTSDGYRVSLRGRKYIGGGHDIGLTVGMATTTNLISGQPQKSEYQWIRLNGTVRLPKRFFLLGEVEVTQGDELAGQRLILELGYRL